MKSMCLTIGRHSIEVQVLEEGAPSHPNEVTLRTDGDDEEVIRPAIEAMLCKRYWWLKDNVLSKEPTQRFTLHLVPGITVELTILGAPIRKCDAESVCEALALFWRRLRNKDHWTLKSIQIPAADAPNIKSGELMRGREFPAEGRFYVYPTTFRETGLYRGVLPCTWLQGAVIHEATHVCLEDALRLLWDQAGGLGWTYTPNHILVRYPGGAERRYLTLQPEACATAYGSYQQDDDRAEGVVALLSGGKLSDDRRALLSRELNEGDGDFPDWSVEELWAELPPMPKIILRIVPEVSETIFRASAGGVVRSPVPPTIYPVDEYLRLLRQGVVL